MSVLLATGGLNELTTDIADTVMFGILTAVGGLMVFAWWKRSLLASAIAFLLLMALGALLEPWQAIAPPPSNYPGAAQDLYQLRLLSVFWTLLITGGLACVVNGIRHRSRISKSVG